MQGLTKRQEQTLDFIRKSIGERGYPPTLREIGDSDHAPVYKYNVRVGDLLLDPIIIIDRK